MNFPFPTLQQGIANTAFEIQRPMLQQQIEQDKLVMQGMQLRDNIGKLQGDMAAQGPGQGKFMMQNPPAFAQGGVIMPGGAMNDPTAGPPGTVWDATLQRWVPKRASKVMGVTQWDVKNFGKYSGMGTSQGGIGRAQPTGPAPVVTPAPAAPVPAAPAMRMPGRGIGVLSPGPAPVQKPAPSPLMNNFPGSGVLTGINRGPARKAAMDAAGPAPANLYQGFQPPAFAQGGVVMPGPAPVPFIVGDEPQDAGAMTATNRVITSGQPNTITSRYGEASATRPEIVVTPSSVEVAGTNGPELRTTNEPTVIMPNPRTVQENLQQIAAPAPAPTGIGANYQPNQPGLQWTGSGFASAPSGPRKTDIRRALRTPQAVMMLMNQQADQQRQDAFMQRDELRFARSEQSQANAQQQAKADKQAEDAAAEARMESMLDALSSEKTILQPAQRAALSKIKGTREKQAALDAFMRMNEAAKEEQAKAAEKQAQGQITWEQVPGADYLIGRDATGRALQTLPKSKPNAKPVEIPEGMEPASMDSTGRVTYKPAATGNTTPKIETLDLGNGLKQSVIWNGTSFVPVQVGAAPSATAPAANAPTAAQPKAELDRYFKR